jgi:hypothetical protein
MLENVATEKNAEDSIGVIAAVVRAKPLNEAQAIDGEINMGPLEAPTALVPTTRGRRDDRWYLLRLIGLPVAAAGRIRRAMCTRSLQGSRPRRIQPQGCLGCRDIILQQLSVFFDRASTRLAPNRCQSDR